MISGQAITQRKLPTTINADRVRMVSPGDTSTLNRGDFSYEQTISYKNGLPWPVTVINRNGFSCTVPALIGNARTIVDFVVYVRYRFARNVILDTQRILDVVSEDSPEELRVLKDAIESSKGNLVMNGNECVVMYSVSRQQLERHGGSVYIDELDVAISTTDTPTCMTTHPESHLGRMLKASMEKTNPGFTFRLEINDPEKQFGDRFLNIAGRVYRVMSTCDTTRPEGVYLATTGDSNEPGGAGETYLKFDDAKQETLLFSTRHDAETLGNVAEARKREIEELQHKQKLEMLKMEEEHKRKLSGMEHELLTFKQEKTRQEAESVKIATELKEREAVMMREIKEREAKLTQEMKEMEAKFAREKAERDSRRDYEKDYYERRSYVRKDSSEIVKWVPAIAVGLGVVVAKLL